MSSVVFLQRPPSYYSTSEDLRATVSQRPPRHSIRDEQYWETFLLQYFETTVLERPPRQGEVLGGPDLSTLMVHGEVLSGPDKTTSMLIEGS